MCYFRKLFQTTPLLQKVISASSAAAGLPLKLLANYLSCNNPILLRWSQLNVYDAIILEDLINGKKQILQILKILI